MKIFIFLICFILFLCFSNAVTAIASNFLDGQAAAIGTTETEIGRMATNLPAGNNTIIVIFHFDGGTANTVNINSNNLKLMRGTKILASNEFQIRTSGSVSGKDSVTMMLLANDTGAPTNPIYNVTAIADATGSNGEVKIVVINRIRSSYENATSVAVGTGQTGILNHNSSMSAGNNTIIAVVQLDNTATATRNIAAGHLNITRQGILLAANAQQITLERTSRPIRDMGILLLANDTGAPANAEYNITTDADNTGINTKVQIIVINELIGAYMNSTIVAIGATETQVGLLNTTFRRGTNVVIAATEFRNTAGATRTIGSKNETLKNGTGANVSNEFDITVGTSGGGAEYRSYGLLWLDENATSGSPYNLTALASNTGINTDTKIIALRITVTLKANGTVTGPTTILTGESTTVAGSCESLDGTSKDSNIFLQNSTDNVTFTTITTDSTAPIFANASSYSIGSISYNSSNFLFSVNASGHGVGDYTLRLQCNATDTVPVEANTTGANLTVNQAWGFLNVTLLQPDPAVSNSNVAQNGTFSIISEIACLSSTNNPTAICGNVNGSVRYNNTGANPDTFISNVFGNISFWLASSYFRPANYTIGVSGVGSSVDNPQSAYDGGFNDTSTFAETISIATGFAEVNYTLNLTKYYNRTAVLYITTAKDIVISAGDISVYNFTSGQFVLWFSPTFTSATTNFTNISSSNGYVNATGHAIIRARSDNNLVSERVRVYDIHVKAPNTKECGFMNYSSVCSLNWSANATGGIGKQYELDVLFDSENSSFVTSNSTADANLTIVPCVADFTVHWASINFGAQVPSTNQNAAPGNAGSQYNISINAGSCATDLYIKGYNLTNSSFTNIIGTGNVTWSNVSNTYSTSAGLRDPYTPVKLNVSAVTNVTTWYWLNVPPVFAGIYNGTITIAGVKNGDAAP